MARLPCPYLKGEVEWTAEREHHVARRHPDLLPKHREQISQTLADPDQVRRSMRFPAARMFSRWYPDLHGGKNVVVVVLEGTAGRYWIVTAYIARRLAEGEIEWKRN